MITRFIIVAIGMVLMEWAIAQTQGASGVPPPPGDPGMPLPPSTPPGAPGTPLPPAMPPGTPGNPPPTPPETPPGTPGNPAPTPPAVPPGTPNPPGQVPPQPPKTPPLSPGPKANATSLLASALRQAPDFHAVCSLTYSRSHGNLLLSRESRDLDVAGLCVAKYTLDSERKRRCACRSSCADEFKGRLFSRGVGEALCGWPQGISQKRQSAES